MESAKKCTDGQCCAESVSKDETIKSLEIEISNLEQSNVKLYREKMDLESKLKTAKEFIKTLI